MTTPKKARKPVIIVHPNELKTKKQQDAFVDKATDTMMGLLDEYARKTGTAPLK